MVPALLFEGALEHAHLQADDQSQEVLETETEEISVCQTLHRSRGVEAEAIRTALVGEIAPTLETTLQGPDHALVRVHVRVHVRVLALALIRHPDREDVAEDVVVDITVHRDVALCVEDQKGDINEESPHLQSAKVDGVVHNHLALEIVGELHPLLVGFVPQATPGALLKIWDREVT